MAWPTSSDVSSSDSITAAQYNNLRADAMNPIVKEQRATSNTTINSGSATDINGATISITPTVAGMGIVWGFFDWNGGTLGDVFTGNLAVDAGSEGALCVYNVAVASGDRKVLGQIWVFPLTAAAHTVKLQAVRSSGTGSATVAATHTKLVLLFVGDDNVTNDTSS